jgi:preprotein translocase subunit SecD
VAAPQGQLRAGRYLASLLGIVVVLFALVFFTGSTNTPKLGLDLQGGTQVTLLAKTDNGQRPSPESMDQARQILTQRVNGAGVASATVVTEGNDRLVISVTGENSDKAKQLSATAQLWLRPVMQVFQIAPTPGSTPTPTGTAAPSGTATPSTSPSPSAKAGSSPTASATPKTNGRPVIPALAPTATPTSPKATATTPTAPATAPGGDASQYPGATPDQLKLLTALDCGKVEQAPSKPDQVVAACERDGSKKYILDKALFGGTEISGANVQAPDAQNNSVAWSVQLNLKSHGQSVWSQYTAAHNEAATPGDIANSVAFVLDDKVVSAPVIQNVINGSTSITGNFDQNSATDLADVLKYGALPLSFTPLNAVTISPTLGTDQLKAGLLAGGIGLALVVVYSLIYYRALGLVTIASLVVSGVLTYGLLVILGRQIGFALTLAGVAGFIVAVGITADSFVILFERLKDEVREGRTARSAVPRAWVRARRTILSADAVSFLAAVILYYFAAGDVKGFAFTLGLSTILDLVVVFLFTHPLIAVLSRSATFTSPRVSGLGAVRKKPLTPAAAASR